MILSSPEALAQVVEQLSGFHKCSISSPSLRLRLLQVFNCSNLLASQLLVECMDSLDDLRRQIGRRLGLGFSIRFDSGVGRWLDLRFGLRLNFGLRFCLNFGCRIGFSFGFRLRPHLCFSFRFRLGLIFLNLPLRSVPVLN